jgi:V8-like Glu-specific endopeptidase
MTYWKLGIASVLLWMIPIVASAQLITLARSSYGSVNLPQTQSTIQLQNILGSNPNFEPIRIYNSEDRIFRLGRSVGRLDVRYPQDAMGTCTASVITPEYIMTNEHCIKERREYGGRPSDISLLMGYTDETDESATERFVIDPRPIEISESLDFAILRVRGNPAAKWGTMTIEARDPLPAESLLVVHHPAGRPMHVTRGGCRAGNPRPIANQDIFHRCDTLPGSSGSPILADRDGAMVGLHWAGGTGPAPTGSEMVNFAKRMSEIAKASPIVRAAIQASRPQSPVQPPPSIDREAILWQSIASSNNAVEFEAFLRQFPTGPFADVARARIAALRTPTPSAVPPNAPSPIATIRPPADVMPPPPAIKRIVFNQGDLYGIWATSCDDRSAMRIIISPATLRLRTNDRTTSWSIRRFDVVSRQYTIRLSDFGQTNIALRSSLQGGIVIESHSFPSNVGVIPTASEQLNLCHNDAESFDGTYYGSSTCGLAQFGTTGATNIGTRLNVLASEVYHARSTRLVSEVWVGSVDRSGRVSLSITGSSGSAAISGSLSGQIVRVDGQLEMQLTGTRDGWPCRVIASLS